MGETIRNTTDFKEWATLVNDSRYSMIAVGDSNIDGRETITADIGRRVPVTCVADVTNQVNSICIDGKECSQQSQEGLNIVVFDNHYRTIIDSIVCSGIGRDIHIFR